MTSGRAGGIAARGQIYMGALIGVVELHFQLEIGYTRPPPPRPPTPLCSATDNDLNNIPQHKRKTHRPLWRNG